MSQHVSHISPLSVRWASLATSIAMVIVMSASMLLTTTATVKAAAGDGASSGLTLLDTNNNGKIDRITFNIANPNAETWRLQGAAPHGLSVTQSGAGITISSVVMTSATTANPITMSVNLSEADTDLQVDTNGVTSAAMELIYTQATWAACDGGAASICDNVDEELNAIATGDTGGTDSESDAAKPVVTAVDFTKATVSGISYNIVDITYSEAIFVSDNGDSGNDIAGGASGASSATLGAMTTATTLEGIGTWATGAAGDMTTSTAVGNTVALNAARTILTVRFNTLASAYFNAGTTAPGVTAFTPVGDANDIDDASGNPVNSAQTAVTSTTSTAWDVTKPTITNTLSQDGGGNEISFVNVVFSENMLDASISVAELEIDNDSTNNGVDETTAGLFFSNHRTTCGGVLDTDANDQGVLLSGPTTSVPGTEAAYVHHNTGQIRDHAGNTVTYGDALGTEVDCAAPYLINNTPTNGAANVDRNVNIVLTFTEAIDTASIDYTLSGYAGSFSEVWSSGDKVLTINPAGSLSGGSHTFTLNVADDASASANVLGGNAESGTSPATFTVSSTSSSGGGSSAPTYSIDLLTPEGNEVLTAGQVLELKWTTGGTGNISYVDLSYSTDGGLNWTMIADNTNNDYSHVWIVPSLASGTSLKVKAEATDLAVVLASDTSASVGIGTSTTTSDDTVVNDDDTVTSPGSGVFGNSPVTGEIEEISEVSVGQYIKSKSLPTVYYIDPNGTRRPFMNESIYFTWTSTFNNIVIVSDATLPTIALGAPMLPKPGVVLVKIVSDNKVYAVDADPANSTKGLLRWIPDEAMAKSIFGTDWADYVIDVPVTLFSRYSAGVNVDSRYVKPSGMKKRVDLHE